MHDWMLIDYDKKSRQKRKIDYNEDTKLYLLSDRLWKSL